MVAEIEDEINFIQFEQPKRFGGKTKSNFFTFYDYVILGLVKHSSMPLRLIIILGFIKFEVPHIIRNWIFTYLTNETKL